MRSRQVTGMVEGGNTDRIKVETKNQNGRGKERECSHQRHSRSNRCCHCPSPSASSANQLGIAAAAAAARVVDAEGHGAGEELRGERVARVHAQRLVVKHNRRVDVACACVHSVCANACGYACA